MKSLPLATEKVDHFVFDNGERILQHVIFLPLANSARTERSIRVSGVTVPLETA